MKLGKISEDDLGSGGGSRQANPEQQKGGKAGEQKVNKLSEDIFIQNGMVSYEINPLWIELGESLKHLEKNRAKIATLSQEIEGILGDKNGSIHEVQSLQVKIAEYKNLLRV